MTREEFNKYVDEEFRVYKTLTCKKYNAEKMFDEAYNIAKITSIKDYLLMRPQLNFEALADFAREQNLIEKISDFEFGYDEPKWLMWDDMDEVIDDFIEEELDQYEYANTDITGETI